MPLIAGIMLGLPYLAGFGPDTELYFYLGLGTFLGLLILGSVLFFGIVNLWG